MIEYGDPETWGMKVDQFLDTSNEQLGTIELADGGVVEREGFDGGGRGGSGVSEEFRKYLNKLEPKELKNAALQDLVTGANEDGIDIKKSNATHVLKEDKYAKIRPTNVQAIDTKTKSKIDKLLDGRIGRFNIVTVDGDKYFKGKRGDLGSSKVGYYRYKPTTQEQREYKRKYENQRRNKLNSNSNRFKSGEKLRDKVWRSFYDSVIDREGNKTINSRFKIDPKTIDLKKKWTTQSTRDIVFIDTKNNNKKITYKNLEKYVDKVKGKGGYKKLELPWKLQETIKNSRGNIKARDISVQDQFKKKLGMDPSKTTVIPFQVHHPNGVSKDPFTTQLTFGASNRAEYTLKNNLLKKIKEIESSTEEGKFGKTRNAVKNFEKDIKGLGNIQSAPGKKLYGDPYDPVSLVKGKFSEVGLGRQARPLLNKLETLVKNIGQEKIKAGKLNQNEFNILRKAVNSSSAQTAIKYGGKALKGLGAVLAPIVLYDTYDQYKKGKPLAEILEYGLIGTDFSRDVRKMANYTPEEREAVQQAQQYERNKEDISGLSSDFDTPTNLSADEISELSVSGPKRVKDLLIAEDEAEAKQRVYAGDPGIADYGEDIEVDERVGLSVGSIPKGVSWVARRIQDINRLIKNKKAGFEDFFDEIQLLEKAEELNLTEGQVNQILKQQQQQRIENYRKLPIQGEPSAKSRLPYDPNANPSTGKKLKIKPRKEKNLNTQDLDYESNIDDIMSNYATGGRVGLKLGTPKKLYDLGKKILKNKEPENPDRRDFLKGAGALGLAITAFGTGALKLAKTLKTKAALKVLAEPAVGQPAWFAPLVDKILLKGIRLEKDGKKLNTYVLKEDGKTITLETSSIPDTTFGYNPPGSVKNPININVKGGGAYDDPFDIHYYQRIDKGPGGDGKLESSFQVLESRPYRFGPDADEVELSEEIFKGSDLLELPKGGSGILSDMEGLEKIATGKIKNTKLANTRMKVRDELNQPDNYRSRYNPGEEDRMTRSTGPDGGEYYENLDGEDYYSAKMEKIRNSEKNDLDPDIDYD